MMKTKHYHDIFTDAGPLIITSLFLEVVLAQKTAQLGRIIIHVDSIFMLTDNATIHS